MMTYEIFKKALLEEVKKNFPEKGLTIKTIRKINKEEQEFLTFSQGSSAVVYLKDLYKRFLKEQDFKKIVEAAIQILSIEAKDMENIASADYIKTHCFFQLINAEKNHDLLLESVHYDYFDLAVVCRVLTTGVLTTSDSEEIQSYILKKHHMQALNVEEEELFRLAKENTKRFFHPEMISLAEALGLPEGMCPPITVLTNDQRTYGATSIIYESILQQFAKERGDFYLLPSSTHEFLLLPKEQGMTPSPLKKIVREVNATAVQTEDLLSDNIYFYSKRTQKIYIITD